MIDKHELRRFPPPWSVEETDACFIVRDANGQALATSTSRWNLEGERAAKLLSRGERNRSRYSFLWLRPSNKSTKALVVSAAATAGLAPEAHHNLRAASARAISFQTPYLWNGTTKKKIEFTKPVMDRADGGDDYARSVAVGHF